MESHVLTSKYCKVSRFLSSEARMAGVEGNGVSEFKRFAGLWDTGASVSAITRRVVEELGLAPVDYIEMYHAQGKTFANVYTVSFQLADGMTIPPLRVIECKLREWDMLIGMDVIGHGDFAISNFNGKTMFGFRAPSKADVDFENEK